MNIYKRINVLNAQFNELYEQSYKIGMDIQTTEANNQDASQLYKELDRVMTLLDSVGWELHVLEREVI